jgi:streptogramin lyase
LQTLPRLKGRSTHVIITEYDLPTKDWWPHDVTLDAKGNIWMGDFGDQFVGMLDPKTMKFTKIALPTVKDDGSPLGNLDLQWDAAGNLWVAEMYQGAIAKVDGQTHEVTTYKLPEEIQNPSTQESFVTPQNSHVDGYVWTTNQDDHSAWKLDVKTGKFHKGSDEKDAKGVHFPAYQIISDSKNGIYLLNMGGTFVGYADGKTGMAEGFKTPLPNSKPRRGSVDKQDRVWYSEFGADAIGMFDPKTRKITEWKLPTKWSAPYGVDYSDKFDEAWAGAEMTDRVARLEVKKDQITEYQLPHQTDIRRAYIDNRGDHPAMWVGNNHAAQIIKIEPLD